EDQPEEGDGAETTEPPRGPPGRQDGKGEGDARLAPDLAVGRGLDSERVSPGGKVGVGGLAPPAVHLVPLPLEPVQPIAVAVLLRRGIAERGEREREDALRMR